MSKHYSPIVHVKLTTTQRDAIASPESGMEIYNITSNQLEHYDGTAWIGGNGIGNIKNGLIGYVPGLVPKNIKILFHIMDTETTFPANVPNSVATCETAPSSTVVLTINRRLSNGTVNGVGTVQFVGGSLTGTISFSTQVVVAVGQSFYIETPSDTFGMSDLFVNILGYTSLPTY